MSYFLFKQEVWRQGFHHFVARTSCMHEKCYNNLAVMGRVQHTWNNDKACGVEDSCTPEGILLDCLMVPGNYSLHWGGKDNAGAQRSKWDN